MILKDHESNIRQGIARATALHTERYGRVVEVSRERYEDLDRNASGKRQ